MISGLIARRAWPWVLAAGAVAVAGCSGGSVPAASTPSALPRSGPAAVSASPSTSASPSAGRAPEPPVLPAAARKPTQAGAEAFFRYFWAVYRYAFHSGQLDAFEAVTLKECTYCSATKKDVRLNASRGRVISGGEITLPVVIADPGKPEEGVLIYSRLDAAPSVITDRSGVLIEKTPGAKGVVSEAMLRWVGGRWRIAEVKVTSKG